MRLRLRKLRAILDAAECPADEISEVMRDFVEATIKATEWLHVFEVKQSETA